MMKKKRLTFLLSLLLTVCLILVFALTGCGTVGPQGPVGPEGPQGPEGPPGGMATYEDIDIDSLDAVTETKYQVKPITNSGMTNMSYKDYSSSDEIDKAGAELASRIAEEGEVLLKNRNNALPLAKGSKVTAFGYYFGYEESNFKGTLGAAGYSLNPSTINLYRAKDSAGGVVGNEVAIDEYSNSVISTYHSYNDAAIVVLYRTGEEGADLKTHDVKGHSNANDHYLQLEDNEKDLIKHVKKYFDRIIVVINSPSSVQIPELAADEGDYSVDAIVWMGPTTKDAVSSIGNILNGTANPSGRTSDLWGKDFTKAPYWTNVGDQSQNIVDGQRSDAMLYYNGDRTNFSSIEYREDIYLGYRYYETGYVDYNKETEGKGTKWYDDQVQYPFGYGLSYTTFDWDVVPADITTRQITAPNESVTIRVRVKNTGNVAGKDVVQLYYAAPYTQGGIEKSAANLVAYQKTELLQPGQSQLVTLKFYAQDMASFDWNDANKNSFKGYELEKGNYELSVRHNSHDVESTIIRTIESDIKCTTDYENGNELFPVFTGEYDSTTESLLANKISRATGMKQPATPTLAERTITKAQYDKLNDTMTYYSYRDQESDPWYVKGSLPSGWTQAESHEGDYSDITVKISDLFGKQFKLDLVDGQVVQGTDADSKLWETFMNQFTWEELCEIVGRGEYVGSNFACYPTIKAMGLDPAQCLDGSNGIGGTKFPGNGVLAASFNDDLAYEMGRMIGNESLDNGTTSWRAPACDLHRSPFGGRNTEYYSEDPLLSAKMTVAAVLGCSSKGVNTEVKHLFANEQETWRDMYGGLGTMATEQALREIYYKPFDAAIKAGTLGLMAAFNKIGLYHTAANNYAVQELLVRRQSGFIGSTCTDAWTGFWTPLNLCARTGTDNCLRDGSSTQDANVTVGYFDHDSNTVMVPANEGDQQEYKNPAWGEKTDAASKAKCTMPSATQYFAIRKSAQRILFTEINTIANRNLIPSNLEIFAQMVRGVDNKVKLETPQTKDITFTGSVTDSEGVDVSFNNDTGVLKGKPEELKDFTITGLKAKLDGRMTSDVSIKIHVVSAFSYEGKNLEGGEIELSKGSKSSEVTIPYYRYGTFLETTGGYTNYVGGPGTDEFQGGLSVYINNVYKNPAESSGKLNYISREEDQMGNRPVVDGNDPANQPYNGGYRFEIQGQGQEGITLEATTFHHLGFKGFDYYEAPSGFKFVIADSVQPGTYDITVKFISSVTYYDRWTEGTGLDQLTYTDTFKIKVS